MHRLTVLYPAKDGEAFSRLKPEGLVRCEFDKALSDPAGG
jgi:hypothetical protein